MQLRLHATDARNDFLEIDLHLFTGFWPTTTILASRRQLSWRVEG
jgi:hypothetical protein